jgi:hypothetical protein
MLTQGSMLLVTPVAFRAFTIFPSGHEVRFLRQRHLIKVKARLADNSFHDTASFAEVSEISPVTTQPAFIYLLACLYLSCVLPEHNSTVTSDAIF